ncbi:MAG TPA: M20 aminoacylase family protein [Casimicrobiaceae bacterium]
MMKTNPVEYVRRWADDFTAIRRDLHAHPELGFEEHRTARLVCDQLTAFGIEHHAGIGKTGIVAVIEGRTDTRGRRIGLRADMDALPLQEENAVPYRSRYDGRMHGCGHDGHTTMLLAAARYLHETRDFDGVAFLIFQPGEEGYAGAKAMIDDGLFTRFPAERVFALHNWPALPPGKIGITPGPAMAAADRIEIVIDGRGGHGAHPHIAVDPVLVAGHIITGVQSIVSRNVSPSDPAGISLCAMQSGNPGAFSVIPAHAKLVGTVRTFRPKTQDLIERRLHELVGSIAAAFGARATLDYQRVYPPTINHEADAEFAAQVAETLVGRDKVVRNLDPSMGAEDFSFMLQAKPGAFARLGQGGAEDGAFLHSSRYDFNDSVLPLGAAYLASLAERAMPLPESSG